MPTKAHATDAKIRTFEIFAGMQNVFFYVLFTDIDGRINAALCVEGTSGCRSTIFLTSKNKTPERAYSFRG